MGAYRTLRDAKGKLFQAWYRTDIREDIPGINKDYLVNGRCVVCNQEIGHDFILHHQTPLPTEVSEKLRAQFRGGMSPAESEARDADVQPPRRHGDRSDD
jgi:hypothetical protein